MEFDKKLYSNQFKISLADKRIKNGKDQKILERRINEAVKKSPAAELG